MKQIFAMMDCVVGFDHKGMDSSILLLLFCFAFISSMGTLERKLIFEQFLPPLHPQEHKVGMTCALVTTVASVVECPPCSGNVADI